MKKTVCLLLALCLIAAMIVSCSDNADDRDGYILDGEAQIYPESFLNIGGEEISFQEFRYYYLNYKNMYIEKNGEEYFDSEEAETALKDEIVNCLKDSVAIKKLADKYSVSLSSEEKAEVSNDIKSSVDLYGGDSEFASILKESYMTRSLYENMTLFSSLYMKVYDTLFADGSENAWGDEEFFDYYQSKYLAAQEILIKYRSAETKDNYPQTMQEIQNIYSEAIAGGDFWSLIEKYGEDEGMEQHPNGYYFTEGEAEDVLYKATLALAENEISQPIVAQDGIYIIKRVPMIKDEMLKNKETALKGYDDPTGTHHSGKYEELFEGIYSSEAKALEVYYPDIWNKISTKTVY